MRHVGRTRPAQQRPQTQHCTLRSGRWVRHVQAASNTCAQRLEAIGAPMPRPHSIRGAWMQVLLERSPYLPSPISRSSNGASHRHDETRSPGASQARQSVATASNLPLTHFEALPRTARALTYRASRTLSRRPVERTTRSEPSPAKYPGNFTWRVANRRRSRSSDESCRGFGDRPRDVRRDASSTAGARSGGGRTLRWSRWTLRDPWRLWTSTLRLRVESARSARSHRATRRTLFALQRRRLRTPRTLRRE